MNQPEHLIAVGDVRRLLPLIPSGSVHCVVTSPPYWGLRDYGTGRWEGGSADCDHVRQHYRTNLANSPASTRGGAKKVAETPPLLYQGTCEKCGATRVDDQIGMEESPEAYIETLVAVFREVRRILRDDGILWLNLGDCYAVTHQGRHGTQHGPSFNETGAAYTENVAVRREKGIPSGLKPKDLCLIPERVAIALQEDGWWVRAKPPWLKPNPMPESVEDRPTTAHESIYLLTKGIDYFYDIDATRTPLAEKSAGRYAYAFGGAKAQALYDADKDGMGVRTVPIGFREPTAGRNRRSVDWFLESLDEAIDHQRAYLAHLERIRERGGMLTDETGETPLGFKVATTPFSGWTKTSRLVPVASGVLSDDTIRRASSDCPIHGNPDHRHGERAGHDDDHTSHNDDRLVREQPRGPRTNSGIPETSTPDGSLDSPARSCSPSATGRSIETNRTGHVPETTSPCRLDVQNPGDTGDKSEQSSSSLRNLDTSENRTSSVDSTDDPSPETGSCSVDIESRPASPSVESLKEMGCTCSFYRRVTDNTSHFAVFPNRLVEPMIRAGTSEAGCCPACGKCWERETEKQRGPVAEVFSPKNVAKIAMGLHSKKTGLAQPGWRKHPVAGSITLGWHPACACDAGPPIACTVLDPFSGAATTGSVADSLGRRYVGLELNHAYAAMGARRIARPHAPAERPPAPRSSRGQQTFF